REDDASDATAQSTDTVFENLGMGVVSADPDQVRALQESTRGAEGVLSVHPELVHHVRTYDYLRGYVDGVGDLGRRLGASGSAVPPDSGTDTAAPQFFRDAADLTWGIQAVGAHVSTWSGQGIGVAV